jgi:hypothetical protein
VSEEEEELMLGCCDIPPPPIVAALSALPSKLIILSTPRWSCRDDFDRGIFIVLES